ncbi:aspartate 1-decarboxylase [Azospirillum canadense]|uniref:aspartate 1-decarboxylase n=1 Tax=Azospirillum canadense TaxID=403962 RepID=UPI0022266B26|nr:aspartate 1-decarboxylase [Azospirillum canadense]MCW2240458.1 aspartate 1-decarboxylase [Azospirillum canadense]
MIKVVRAKLHGIHVTDANLNYHGSITLDPDHCDAVGLYPLEFVEIWNRNSGARISTYVIFGERGSRCCVLNGAAARTCQPGDDVIIAASWYCQPTELATLKPRVVTFHPDNRIADRLTYDVTAHDDGRHDFRIRVGEPDNSQP